MSKVERVRAISARWLRCKEPLLRALSVLAPTSPAGLLAGGFAALIAVGTLLLRMPVSHHGDVGLLDALFTSTSAVCVTGLVVVDTGTAFTGFGQLVILVLIQVGGLGVMTFAAIAFQLLGRRLSLRAHAALAGSLLHRDLATELRSTFQSILRAVLVIEGLGAAVLFVGLLARMGLADAAWSAVFHAVSAFCNAGFSLYPDSLTALRGNVLVAGGVMALIVLGGVGHPVLVDVWRWLRERRGAGARRVSGLTLHSRVVLGASAALIATGAALLVVLGLTDGESGMLANASAAVFQSVTARTAGFNTVDIGALPAPSLLVLVMLMFIGGSPGSCAGGIKTTTFMVWLARLLSTLRGEKSARLGGRHIPGELTRRAALLIDLAVIWNLTGLLVLVACEGGVGLHELLFEQISAFGTVGLSTGVTSALSTPGRLWVIATMFVGRVGPLTVVSWIFAARKPAVLYPEGRLLIG